MPPAIRVENLSKSYRISHAGQKAPYRTLRESLVEAASGTLRRWRRSGEDARTEEFWALKEVDFEVQPGEVVGIIGRNGAGKSTLLKILSRITEPTSGRVRTRGRLGSLLEVGTGFHLELTGRENIYLSGSIIGMGRREIDRKFDEIVGFAEIERFLDTPVKRYSSGMYVRLAFAVAAHLDPEILLVDEVLAVGDATYQRRCLDRMKDLANGGRSILFVSHNMQIIPQLCHNAILLERGQVLVSGGVDDIIQRYTTLTANITEDEDLSNRPRNVHCSARLSRVDLLDPSGQPIHAHITGNDLIVRIEIISARDIPDAALAVVLQNVYGMRVITSWTREVGFSVSLRKGRRIFDCRFREVNLRPGHSIRIGLWLDASGETDWVEDARTVSVCHSEETRDLSPDQHQGIVVCKYEWSEVEPATVGLRD
jgi:lipopolysaccharide transport system ATP-binding protein